MFRTQKPLEIPDIRKDSRFGVSRDALTKIRSLYVFPLTTANCTLGTVCFASRKEDACDTGACELLTRIAELLAIAAERMTARQKADEYQEKLVLQRGRFHLLMEINKLLFGELDSQGLLAAVSHSIHRLLRHDYAFLVLQEPGTNQFRLHAMDCPPGTAFLKAGVVFPADPSPAQISLEAGQPLVLNGNEIATFPGELTQRAYEEGIRSICCVPLRIGARGLGSLWVASLQPNSFTEDDVELLCHVGEQVTLALENAFAFGQVSELIDKLEQEKLYLESEVGSPYRSDDIIGDSRALAYVLEQVRTVAATHATVLVLGETGTGKELVARAIHRLSERNQGSFVKVNCSAIPAGLLESELFGHEKGAFTGAIQQKLGRVELADKGTLFLDEVGDIPLELQPKLLRVLQEQEFERLGSNHTLRVDVRIVAATHRNLEEMVDSGEFRRDLFYRLNVFPIHVPPLRERKEDIPILVRHFVKKFAKRMDRRIGTIPTESMSALQQWQWPGNVRELENLCERAVILSPGKTLNVPLAQLKSREGSELPLPTTLAEADKAHIIQVLKETNGVIAGPAGAAARLGIKRTTLNYKMKKLGIKPRSL